MEEQILHYYLKVFSIIFITLLLLLFFYIYTILSKNIILNKDILNIQKGQNFEKVLIDNFKNLSSTEIFIINKYYEINFLLFDKFIHFGDFYLENKISPLSLIQIITKSSNVINKITIIEGWSKKDLYKELLKHFKNIKNIPYDSIIADTYFIEKNKDFEFFLENLKNIKNQYFEKKLDNKIYNLLNQNEIMIVGSLIEREGLDREDKKKISSVIINRLKKKMKLQIDATVIFAITNGQYDLNRKLLIRDLKINHPFNTYQHYGLPPEPISYVGKETLDIIFENYGTEFLFYFFDNSLKGHIFSTNFEEHKNKLNEYRKK